MIANYGYQDGEGTFYITIVQDDCAACEAKPCIAACPASVLVEEEGPYGDSVAAVDARKLRKVKYECMPCKPNRDRPPLPCVAACPRAAIAHSW